VVVFGSDDGNSLRAITESIIYHLDSLLPVLFFIFALSLLPQKKSKQKTKSAMWLIVFSIYWMCELFIVWQWDYMNSYIYHEIGHYIYRMILFLFPISMLLYAISFFFPHNKFFHKSTSFFLQIASCIGFLYFFSNIYYTISPRIWFEYIYMFFSFLQVNVAILFIFLVLTFKNTHFRM
jgi:hypothetical protein